MCYTVHSAIDKFQGLCRHFLLVPPGPNLLSDVILSSPILAEEHGVSLRSIATTGQSGSGGSTDFEFGVDPSLDPELAMVCTHIMEVMLESNH